MNHSFKTFAGLLLGAVAIVGCQREPQVEPNPNFNPETDEVNAAFVMSVSTGSTSTKMSADNVQKNTNFLGITDSKLILFATGIQPAAPYVKSGDASKALELYDLGTVLTSGAINAANNASSESNRILQLSIPLGADAALFYGKAINNAPGKVQGKMKWNIDKDPASTWFGVEPRIGDNTNINKYDATGRLMIYAINTILESNIAATDSYTLQGVEYKDLPPLSWETLGHQWEVNNASTGGNPYNRTGTVTAQSELAKSMGQAYATFTHINTTSPFNEYRAGSSVAVKAMIQSIYSVLSNTAKAEPLNKDEANVIRLANAAIDNVNKFYKDDWNYKDILVIKTAVVPSMMDEETWTSKFSGATDLNGYPYKTFGIPEGAAQLAFDPTTDDFSYTNPNKALVTPGKKFDPRKYTYPAELAYYVNSPLWVTSKSSLTVSDFPNGTTPWKTTGEGSKWTVGSWSIDKVVSSTRGVAIRDNINYSVALLETNVAWATGITSIKDNRKVMTNSAENDRTIPIEDTKFILRGILIGGVHPRYNWQFVPRALTTEEAAETVGTPPQAKYGIFDGVIYDDAIPSTAIPTTAPNYTLVYDNYDYTKADNAVQNDVYVALEFVNNGDAFWGRDNLIPAGGVFYLGAKLTVAPKKLEEGHTSEDQEIAWPTDHQIPPIYESGDNAGKSKQIPRVFIQDFLTKATFRIGENSLKYAYYTVPDLASSQMSFGLSVDLSWQSGYEYDIEFGANPGPTN